MRRSEILRAGKRRLEQRGWCKGDEEAIHGGPERRCCAASAICDPCEDIQSVMDILGFFKEVNGIPNGAISDWNDAPERTLEEVYAAYDRAIAAAEAKEAA